MSYLRKLARESRARFEPKRTRGLAPENTLRVEESFVEAPKPEPASHAESPRVAIPTEHPIAPVTRHASPATATPEATAPHIAHPVVPKETGHPTHVAQPAAIEIRRELPDAIEDLVVFDRHETPRSRQPMQLQPQEPIEVRRREAPDPRQAESVMARIRALTRQRTNPPQPAMEAAPRTPAEPREPVVAEPKSAKVAPTSAKEIARPDAKRNVYFADDVESEVQAMARGTARTVNSSRSTQLRSESQRTPQDDAVQVSIGSVVVHVEPEALPTPAATQNQPTRASSNFNADADNRWARSFLDRV